MNAATQARTTTIAHDLDIHVASKRFDSSQSESGSLQVLQDVSLHLPAGEFVSIVGASGCGKSTLLRLVLGLDTDYQGRISLGGQPVEAPGLDRGIVFQDHRLFPWLTVAQNIGVGLRNADLSAARKRDVIAEHVALVGLEGFEQSFPHQISGGMAQRVAIARGLVNRPRVLLLDEPFGALDALTRARLQAELQQIWQRERITMLLVTHDVEEAVFLGDRVVVMQPYPGRIRRIVPVDLPRPRNRSDPAFLRIRDDVMADFLDPAERGPADVLPAPPPAPSFPVPGARLQFAW